MACSVVLQHSVNLAYMSTIFPKTGFDRRDVKWEDHLYDLTPVEKVGDIYLKREDQFAPLGYSGINGSKLRQLIWLFRQTSIHPGVASGAVRGSPQHAMVAACAKHYGLECLQFVGGRGGKKSDVLEMAEVFGASLQFVNPGYAATLNSKAKKYALERGWLHIETNITVDHDLDQQRARWFHEIGSQQVKNIPDHIRTLIVPAGSCNSAVSVLYGVAKFRPKSLERVILLGIGSHGSRDPSYIFRRLQAVEETAPLLFRPMFMHNTELEKKVEPQGQYDLIHYNLNGTGYCTYEQLMPYTYCGVEMHPRYEGKCFNYMLDEYPDEFVKYMNEETCFWVVGSRPSLIG